MLDGAIIDRIKRAVHSIEVEAFQGAFSGPRDVLPNGARRSGLRDAVLADLLPDEIRRELAWVHSFGALHAARMLLQGWTVEQVVEYIRGLPSYRVEPPPYRGRRVR